MEREFVNGENYYHKKDYERLDLLVKSYVDCYSRKYGGSNCKRVTMDDFFYQRKLEAKLYADSPLLRINMHMGISCKLGLHLSYIATEAIKAIESRDGIGDDNINSLV